jgi:hypothetical protein
MAVPFVHAAIARARNPHLAAARQASGSGGRSALAGKTLQELGYASVYNAGRFKELADAGLATEPA